MRDCCLSVSLSGNPPFGWDKVREGLSTSCRFQSKADSVLHTHTFTFMCTLCVCVYFCFFVILSQVVSMHLYNVLEGRGYVA